MLLLVEQLHTSFSLILIMLFGAKALSYDLYRGESASDTLLYDMAKKQPISFDFLPLTNKLGSRKRVPIHRQDALALK